MKKNACFQSIFAVLALGALNAAPALRGQAVKSSGADADDEWRSLTRNTKSLTILPPDASAAEVAVKRTQAVGDLIERADALRSFYSLHPGHTQAKEARVQEAIALLLGAQAGDDQHAGRLNGLLNSIRHDPSLSSQQRSAVVAFEANLNVQRRPHATKAALLADYEAVARDLISDFPDVGQNYQALLQIGKQAGDAKLAELAGVVAASRAPESVKAEAKRLETRLKHRGRQLADIVAVGLGAGDPLVPQLRGRPAIIYSWSTASPDSQVLAQRLAAGAAPGTVLVGVNLDTNVAAAAKAASQASALPGMQIYDARGPKGILAFLLTLDVPGLAFQSDPSGVLASMSAQLDVPRPPTTAAGNRR